jgi:hypothetical protein
MRVNRCSAARSSWRASPGCSRRGAISVRRKAVDSGRRCAVMRVLAVRRARQPQLGRIANYSFLRVSSDTFVSIGNTVSLFTTGSKISSSRHTWQRYNCPARGMSSPGARCICSRHAGHRHMPRNSSGVDSPICLA